MKGVYGMDSCAIKKIAGKWGKWKGYHRKGED
jgi:hypothetical protein